jgi:hypothetical protein
MNNDTKYLHQLLDTACGLIDSLESLHLLINEREYLNSDLATEVERFFNDIKDLDEQDFGPEIDSAGFSINDRDGDAEAQDYGTFGSNKI